MPWKMLESVPRSQHETVVAVPIQGVVGSQKSATFPCLHKVRGKVTSLSGNASKLLYFSQLQSKANALEDAGKCSSQPTRYGRGCARSGGGGSQSPTVQPCSIKYIPSSFVCGLQSARVQPCNLGGKKKVPESSSLLGPASGGLRPAKQLIIRTE